MRNKIILSLIAVGILSGCSSSKKQVGLGNPVDPNQVETESSDYMVVSGNSVLLAPIQGTDYQETVLSTFSGKINGFKSLLPHGDTPGLPSAPHDIPFVTVSSGATGALEISNRIPAHSPSGPYVTCSAFKTNNFLMAAFEDVIVGADAQYGVTSEGVFKRISFDDSNGCKTTWQTVVDFWNLVSTSHEHLFIEQIVGPGQALSIASDQDNVYVGTENGIFKIPYGNAIPVILFVDSGINVRAMHRQSFTGDLYFTSTRDDCVYEIPKLFIDSASGTINNSIPYNPICLPEFNGAGAKGPVGLHISQIGNALVAVDKAGGGFVYELNGISGPAIDRTLTPISNIGNIIWTHD